MQEVRRTSSPEELYSSDEIAQAAGVTVPDVDRRLRIDRVRTSGGFVAQVDAICLVRAFVAERGRPSRDRPPLTLLRQPQRRTSLGLAASSVLHAGVIAMVVIASLGLLNASSPERPVQDEAPARLVFFMTPGLGGGGGGGGVRIPAPARRAARKAIVKAKPTSPVPEVRREVPPPRPAPPAPLPPVVEPPPAPKVEPPPVAPPAPAVNAPVVPRPADQHDAVGVVTPAPKPSDANQGAGTGGGVGTGAGHGAGEGDGSGIGPGSGGGIGGGPYRAGAGIEAPTLLREVKANYTDEARRKGIQGEVILEIVVRRDGSVGDVRVLRGLRAGLEREAIDAVRQWRFGPARRHGVPVDVIVEVSVAFKLR